MGVLLDADARPGNSGRAVGQSCEDEAEGGVEVAVLRHQPTAEF
jgi:hypothetical protein